PGIKEYHWSPLGLIDFKYAYKEQVIDMTMRLLGIRDKIKPDDAADGLAMAIYAVYSSHSQRLNRKVQL
ncbi:MAG: crossover junction endodeoxyribonuclease RuvC, partial [Anaeroglobus sp.]